MSEEALPPQFDYNDVSNKVLIGQGSYGKIFKGKKDSESVALKVMDCVDDEDIIKEAKFLLKLKHPNVVKVKGICLSESCIMMEFMSLDLKPYGLNTQVHSANDLIKELSKPNSHGYELLIVQLAQGVLNGLTFLHEKGVSHRDLKPSNILVSNPKVELDFIQVKLSDFGESWGNIVQATQCMKTHTTNIYKG